MPSINLKSLVSSGKSTVGQIAGNLENVAGAAGKGAFSVSAGPNGVSLSANFNELIKNKVQGNRVSSPLKKLYTPNGDKVKEPIIFPYDIDDEKYMIYNVMTRDRQDRTQRGEKRILRTIVLPIPTNLTTTYAAQYDNQELGVFGAMASGRVGAAELGSAASDLSSLIQNKISAASNAFKSADLDAASKAAGILGPVAATAAAGTAAGAVGGLLALGGTSGGVVAGLGVSEGLAINPHMAVLFKGIGFREHTFSYKLIARNQTESTRIRQLISTFKYHMHPNYGFGNLAFQYPDEFEIEFSSALSPYLYKIGTSVLTGFDVNYNAEGIPAFYDSGAPVSIEVTMRFQETKILTKGDMDEPEKDQPLYGPF